MLRPIAQRLLPVLALGLLASLPYGNTLNNEFVYDDLPRIVENPVIRDWANWRIAFAYARPLPLLSFMVDYHLWGLHPAGWHVTNIAAHALTTVLLFFLTRHLLTACAGVARPTRAATTVAWTTAALFAIHPVHTEAVTGVSNRQEMFMAIFLMASLRLYSSRTRTRLAYAGALGFLALATASKQLAFVGILLWLLRDLWCEPGSLGTILRRRWRRYSPVLAVAFVVRDAVTGLSPHALLASHGLPERVYTMTGAFFQYLTLLSWPRDLSADVFVPVRTRPDATVFFVWSGIIVAVVLIVRAHARRGWLAFAVAAYLLAWSPLCNVLGLTYPVAERYLYFPSGWFFMAVAIALYAAFARLKGVTWCRRTGAIVSIVCVLLAAPLTARTFVRNRDWRDSESLWRAAVRTDPLSYRAHYNLGNALLARERFDEALGHHRWALRLDPTSLEARNNLGLALLGLARYPEARKAFLGVLEHDPRHWRAMFNLACVASREGEVGESYLWLSKLDAARQLPRGEIETDEDLKNLRASRYYELLAP